MAYTPPNTFSASTKLLAADVQANTDALRVYLHKGVVSTDMQSATWIEARHIQPPIIEPWQGVQHGVGGHMVSQWGGGESVRLTFMTSYLTGGGLVGNRTWVQIPNTSVKIDIRREAKVLFHWWCEVEHGPDDVPYVSGRNYPVQDRLAYICPYVGNLTGLIEEAAQEGQNHQFGWSTGSGANKIGAVNTYTSSGGYGQRDGCVALTQPIGTLTIGLAAYSQIDRCGIVNWGFSLETYYL